MYFKLEEAVRPNILALKPYSSARDEFSGTAEIYLDANENPYPNGFNRYPDPLAIAVKKQISTLKNVPVEQIFLGNGSDEAIDLLFRIFCNAGENVIILPPTYGMYEVCANIADIEVRKVPLMERYFQLEVDEIFKVVDKKTKIIFVCTPNNPTGNDVQVSDIEIILFNFSGIVVVDEAYIDFSRNRSCSELLKKYPNLVVLQTFSKAWGMAGIRLGMAFASKAIIALFNKTKPPYNINTLTQETALKILKKGYAPVQKRVKTIVHERENFIRAITFFNVVSDSYHSNANFVLVQVTNADKVYRELTEKGIIVRNRNNITLCHNCIRVTIGTPAENKILIAALESLTNDEV
jgi:histidinol-phosphate aminotransferase